MTTYVPSITLPDAVFANPAASILVPVGLGLGVGYSVSRMQRSLTLVEPAEAEVVQRKARRKRTLPSNNRHIGHLHRSLGPHGPRCMP